MRVMSGKDVLEFLKEEVENTTNEAARVKSSGTSLQELLLHTFLSGMLQAYMRTGDFLFDHEAFMENKDKYSAFPKVELHKAESMEEAIAIMESLEESGEDTGPILAPQTEEKKILH